MTGGRLGVYNDTGRDVLHRQPPLVGSSVSTAFIDIEQFQGNDKKIALEGACHIIVIVIIKWSLRSATDENSCLSSINDD